MDVELTEGQRLIQRTAREFAERELLPRAAELDRREEFPADLVKRLGELGFMGMMVPEAYGGAGVDTVSYVLAMEEISRACASTGAIMTVNNSLVCAPILEFGSAAQRETALPPLARGEKLGCFALTEPESGSDAASLRTTARRGGCGWRLDGTKRFITNGREADLCLLFATRDRALRHRGISAFLVETGAPGFAVGRLEGKLGLRATSCAEIILEGCHIPAEALLGQEGQGFRIAMKTLEGGRIGVAAQALGIARAALEESVAHARQRVQFGRPIGAQQAIQWMVADMATGLDAARLLTLRAAQLKDGGEPFGWAASMAKVFASECAMGAATKGVQVHGGYGYIREFAAERHFRDAKITEIYEGTSEIQRLIIAEHLLA
ncbi:MAG: acyl-CoA dehydrogenase family protein [Nitrospinota bacterium]